jgi:glycosyltransferase involved in cell wall biosynthesis
LIPPYPVASEVVSILIPCYNASPWLADTIKSALNQTYSPIEIIVVDDGSTDGSASIARSFEGQGVKVFIQPNSGASAARNRAWTESHGAYLQFLDADDLLSPDKIAEQVRLLRSLPADYVATCRWARFIDDSRLAKFADHAVFHDYAPTDYLLDHTADGRMMHPAAWLTPRAVANQAGPWNETLTLNDDGEFFARVAATAQRIVFSSTGASYYRTSGPDSLSRRRDRRALDSLARSVALVSKHLERLEYSPRVRAALARYWQRTVFDLYPAAPALRRHAENEVRRLGGTDLQPAAGPWRQLLHRLIGWKATKLLHNLIHDKSS